MPTEVCPTETASLAEYTIFIHLTELARRLGSLALLVMHADPGQDTDAYKQLLIETGQELQTYLALLK